MTRAMVVSPLQLDVARVGERSGDTVIPASLSSEHPIERIDSSGAFYEVLSHAPDAVNLERAPLPLLLSHDQREQVGVIENMRVTSDRKLRGDLRLSRGQRGQEIAQDIRDGIRRSISIAYLVDESKVVDYDADGTPIRRLTRWTPIEGSLVSVPADPTVGVRRTLAAPFSQGADAPAPSGVETMTNPSSSAGAPAVHVSPNREAEFLSLGSLAGESAAEITAALRQYQTPEQYSAALLAKRSPSADQMRGARAPESTSQLPSEFREHVARAIFAPDAARELSRHTAQQLGLAPRGNLVPLSHRASYERTLTSTGSGSGAEVVQQQASDFIDLMRPTMILAGFGAKFQTFNGYEVRTPALRGDAAYVWLDENPGSGVSASNLTTAVVTMKPHMVATRTTITKQLWHSASPDVAMMTMDAHARRLAIALDAAGLAGTGASNQPIGVLFNTDVSTVAMGTHGGTLTYAKLCELEESIDAANAPMNGLGFVTTPQIRSRARQIQDFPSASAGRPLWDAGNTVLGHRAMTTTSMPSDLTKGTSTSVCHGAILGDFSQVLIGTWGALDVVVDNYTDAAKGLVHITTALFVDVAVIQPDAFAVIVDLKTS